MRLLKIVRQRNLVEGTLITRLVVTFVANGIEVVLPLTQPANFDTMTRAEKVSWGKAQIAAYLSGTNLGSPDGEVIYPDNAAQETAADNFDGLNGWATWTAAEAESWINANVTTLATAKVALVAMAKAIVYLRNISIPH